MRILDKVKKGEKMVSKEAKEEIHYLKGDLKDVGKQLRTKESLVIKNEVMAILHCGMKNHKSFLSEFEKLTREGFMLTGTSLTRGLPLNLLGFDVKTGLLFYFQNTKFFDHKSS